MKFLLDAHLPPVLARIMIREGYEAAHSFELGMPDSSDREIWQYAKENGYVILSKDEDFAHYLSAEDDEPKFVWVRTGNCKNQQLISVII